MSIPDMVFTPSTGLNDTTYSPTNPVSESAIRSQIQGICDQLRDYINNTLKPGLVAGNIPITAISGLVATEVQSALAELKGIEDANKADLEGQIAGVVLGQIPNGSLTDIKLSNEGTEIKARFATHLADYAHYYARQFLTMGG